MMKPISVLYRIGILLNKEKIEIKRKIRHYPATVPLRVGSRLFLMEQLPIKNDLQKIFIPGVREMIGHIVQNTRAE